MGEDGQLAIGSFYISNPAIILNHFDAGDFHKKRKYEEAKEEFGHPTRKPRFQSHECGFECQIHAKESEREVNREPSFPLDRTESVEDSNSFMGIYDDTTLSMDAESADQTYMELYKPYSAEAASSSGNSCDSVNDNIRRNLYSLESRRNNNKTCRKSKESVPTTLEDGTLCKSKSLQDPLSAFEMNYEAYTDFVSSEYGLDKEQISDFPTEELLYSNDVEPNILLLPSGGRSSMQEAQGNNRKPTIDQEFEQYFSSLML